MYTAIAITYTAKRRAWYRGEKAALRFDLMNFHPVNEPGCTLRLDFGGGLWHAETELPVLGTVKEGLAYEIDTAPFKSGDYALTATLTQGARVLSAAAFALSVAPPRRANSGMPLWHWPATVHDNALSAGWVPAQEELDLLAHLGYRWAQMRSDWALAHQERAARLIEYAMMRGIELGFRFENGLGSSFFMDRDIPEEGRLIGWDGKPHPKLADHSHPAVQHRNQRQVEAVVDAFRDFPSCSTLFMNTEIEDRLQLALNPPSARRHEQRLGFPLSRITRQDCLYTEPRRDGNFAEPGVIRDDDPDYCYTRYYFKEGDGFVPNNRLMAAAARALRPDLMTISDPFRLATVHGRFDGMGAVSSWTYTNPDPKSTLFTETLVNEAKPADQAVIPTITLWNYAGTLVPCGANRFAREQTLRMEPDRFCECVWINFSRGPRAIGTYIGSPIEPFLRNGDPFIYSPATEDAMARITRDLLAPFGDFARGTAATRRRIAILDSLASSVYAVSPRPHTHYPNYRIYGLYTVLAMAHYEADVLFEEDVEQDALARYDMLVLPHCDTLTQTVCGKLRGFAARGGRLVADQYLRADLPLAARLDFNFTYRRRVNANANTKKQDFSVKDDHSAGSAAVQLQGIPADEDQRIMEGYAAETRRRLAPVAPARDFDCDSPRLLLHAREAGGVRYLFVVNDRRTWGERVAQWRSMLEKGLPESATITFPDPGFEPAVYELTTHRRVPVRRTEGGYAFDLTVPAASGAILAFYQEPPKAPTLDAPNTLVRGEEAVLHFRTGFGDGLQPVEVTITAPDGTRDDYSGYYLANHGVCDIPVIPAINTLPGHWTIAFHDLTTNATLARTIPAT